MDKIKVMIVDDQPIVRDGLNMILSLCDDIEVISKAQNGKDAVLKCSDNIDIVLMDITMPEMNGVEATSIIKEKFPDTKVIILTTFNDDKFIFDALKNGASSYLLKDMDSEEIINAIKLIHSGKTVLQSNIAQKLINKSSKDGEKNTAKLTQREIEIARLIAKGLSNKEIAKKLFVTEGTVKNHVTNILSKTSLNQRTQIVLYVLENNI